MKLYTEQQIQALMDAAVAKAVAPLLKRIEALELENARLKKNSSNSKKPLWMLMNTAPASIAIG